ncbi:hypothetical protein U1872_19035 [Sphingomonas sp. RB3P16]|uniref:hypothetical protein n=1 Tax=Parasphingomonas frigoris TaxID=3096163 RepID=UPI002FCB1572
MTYALKLYLIITGIGTALCLTMPGLVVVGFFLILPGLILFVMPTAFLWGSCFALLWFPLRLPLGDLLAAMLAAPATVVLLWVLPASNVALSKARLAVALRPDVVPTLPIRLSGHLRIDVSSAPTEEFDPTRPTAARPLRCIGLCAAALFTEGVESVTVNVPSRKDLTEADVIGATPLQPNARTFRRVARADCAVSLLPTGADGLGLDYPERRSKEAEWNLRLSTTDCIIAVPTRSEHDISIAQGQYDLFGGSSASYDWSFNPKRVAVSRFELRARGGRVLLRKLVATTLALRRPLWIDAGGSFTTFRFGWARTALSNAPRYETVDGGALLAAHTNLAVHADPAATARLARTRLQAMLADPRVTAEDPGWAAADAFFTGMRRTIEPGDHALLVALIRDHRMTRFEGFWDAKQALRDDSAFLRAAIVERLTTVTDDDREANPIRVLSSILYAMPPGTFATPSAAERALLADPVMRLRAGGLIMRQADRGAAAVPDLVAMLGYHVRAERAANAMPKRRRRISSDDSVAIEAVRVALCRLGPDGAAALPDIAALDAEALPPQRFDRRSTWHLTLARLGYPIDSLDIPQGYSGTNERYRENLRRRLEHFRADSDCR